MISMIETEQKKYDNFLGENPEVFLLDVDIDLTISPLKGENDQSSRMTHVDCSKELENLVPWTEVVRREKIRAKLEVVMNKIDNHDRHILEYIRGMNKSGRLNCISNFIKNNKIDFVGFQETKKVVITNIFLDSVNRNMIWKTLSAKGTTCGILVRFKMSSFNIISWQ
jgi:hypothetical protein